MVNYPVGIQTFEEIRKGGYLYIDKTQLVYKLCHPGKYIFLSRPRRFGKSLLTSTLDAYFSGRRDLFKGLAIEQLETEWKQYPVLHFSLASAKRGTVEDTDNIISNQLDGMERKYGLPVSNGNITVRPTTPPSAASRSRSWRPTSRKASTASQRLKATQRQKR